MAAEPRRGCGYRKIGGLYLVSDPGGIPCDRLPIPLTVCPTCSCGIKQARSWTWVDVAKLIGGDHQPEMLCTCWSVCPLCTDVAKLGRAGLLWIGEKFYKTVADFEREAQELGVSRRIPALPRGFKIGTTWVLLAHPLGITQTCETCKGTGLNPAASMNNLVEFACEACEGNGKVSTPAIFKVWRPQRVEKILPESLRDSEDAAEWTKKGYTVVFLPDNDPDHQGSVYDKPGKEEETE